jgi:hypothetical protein
MAAFPHEPVWAARSGRDCLTQQGRKISIALINSCPGKICLVPPVRMACGKRALARQDNNTEPESQ